MGSGTMVIVRSTKYAKFMIAEVLRHTSVRGLRVTGEQATIPGNPDLMASPCEGNLPEAHWFPYRGD